jgi:chromosome partitioning protein
MFRVTIVNSKGGSGKTTLATNLASYYCTRHLKTTLIDFDSQGSSSDWISRRPSTLPTIDIISAYKQSNSVTRSWFLRPSRDTQRVIIDSPSGLNVSQFSQTLNESDAILIPVLPSMIDMHAVANFVGDILKCADIKRKQGRIAVVANRTRKNTIVFNKLEIFLKSLGIPFITSLRDSQQYIRATEAGLGLFEMPRPNPIDIETWQPIINWVNDCANINSEVPSTNRAS